MVLYPLDMLMHSLKRLNILAIVHEEEDGSSLIKSTGKDFEFVLTRNIPELHLDELLLNCDKFGPEISAHCCLIVLFKFAFNELVDQGCLPTFDLPHQHHFQHFRW